MPRPPARFLLALGALGLSGCTSYDPDWATRVFTVPVVGSLQETLSVSALSLAAGGSAQLQVTLTPAGGFAGLVQLAPVGGPAGLSLAPNSVDLEGTAPVTFALTVSASAQAAPGSYAVTLVAANINQAAQAPVALTVGPTAP